MKLALKDTTCHDKYLTLVGAKTDEHLRLGAPPNLPPSQPHQIRQ
jgi:hypothetical protein